MTKAQGGTLFLDQYLLHDVHTHSMLPTLVLLSKYLSTFGLLSLSLAVEETLCLYHTVIGHSNVHKLVYCSQFCETLIYHIFQRFWLLLRIFIINFQSCTSFILSHVSIVTSLFVCVSFFLYSLILYIVLNSLQVILFW